MSSEQQEGETTLLGYCHPISYISLDSLTEPPQPLRLSPSSAIGYTCSLTHNDGLHMQSAIFTLNQF